LKRCFVQNTSNKSERCSVLKCKGLLLHRSNNTVHHWSNNGLLDVGIMRKKGISDKVRIKATIRITRFGLDGWGAIEKRFQRDCKHVFPKSHPYSHSWPYIFESVFDDHCCRITACARDIESQWFYDPVFDLDPRSLGNFKLLASNRGGIQCGFGSSKD